MSNPIPAGRARRGTSCFQPACRPVGNRSLLPVECSSSGHWVSGQIHHAESPTGRARHSAAQDLSRNPESAGKRLSPEHATASSLFEAKLLTAELRSFITYPHSFTFIPHPFHPLSLFPSTLSTHSLSPSFPILSSSTLLLHSTFHSLSFYPPPSLLSSHLPSFFLPSLPFLPTPCPASLAAHSRLAGQGP